MDFLRKQDLTFIKTEGDKALDFNEIIGGVGGTIAEASDGIVISLTANQINKWLNPQLSDQIKQEFHDVFDEIQERDYKGALIQLADVGIAVSDDERIPDKLKPWISIIIEIYKGIITSVMA